MHPRRSWPWRGALSWSWADQEAQGYASGASACDLRRSILGHTASCILSTPYTQTQDQAEAAFRAEATKMAKAANGGLHVVKPPKFSCSSLPPFTFDSLYPCLVPLLSDNLTYICDTVSRLRQHPVEDLGKTAGWPPKTHVNSQLCLIFLFRPSAHRQAKRIHADGLKVSKSIARLKQAGSETGPSAKRVKSDEDVKAMQSTTPAATLEVGRTRLFSFLGRGPCIQAYPARDLPQALAGQMHSNQ